MEETETTDREQSPKTEHLKPWQFKKGQSGNPMGRPPGRSLKDRAKAYLSGLTDEEAVAFFEGMDKKVIWEMAEGKAAQTVDSNVEVTFPKPLLDHVRNNDSNQEATETQQEN